MVYVFILAIDGSRFTLLFTKELEKIYGKMTNQNKEYIVQAKISVLYDVLNNMCLGGVFSPFAIGEREQSEKLLDHCQEGDLIIYDRG